jgi:hypothetical protein
MVAAAEDEQVQMQHGDPVRAGAVKGAIGMVRLYDCGGGQENCRRTRANLAQKPWAVVRAWRVDIAVPLS